MHGEGQPQVNPKQLGPLALAFLGDAVYELCARQRIVAGVNAPVGDMHAQSVAVVNAGAQSAAFLRLEPHLSEEELAIYKRGRNASPGSVPKNAQIADYHRATGMEALFGYLFLKGEQARIQYLFDLAVGESGQEG